MGKRLQRLLTIAGMWLSRPWAVGAVFLYGVLWLAFEPGQLRLARRSRHRYPAHDPIHSACRVPRHQAIHAKLDELLRVNGDARNQLTNLDEKQPEQIEAFRDLHP
jgi:low affinity Fe/Cu permease